MVAFSGDVVVVVVVVLRLSGGNCESLYTRYLPRYVCQEGGVVFLSKISSYVNFKAGLGDDR